MALKTGWMKIKERYLPAYISALCFVVLFFFVIANFIDYSEQLWIHKRFIPAYHPFGLDYKYIYDATQSIFQTGSFHYTDFVYPPFVLFLNIPTALFSYKIAYTLQMLLLFCANIAVVTMMAGLSFDVFSRPKEKTIELFYENYSTLKCSIILSILIVQICGYGFLFSLERGNCDIYPVFFSLLAIRLLLNKPNTVFLQILFLSFAIHLKIYPLILLPLFIYVHRKKSILPIIAVNAILLLLLGPAELINYIRYMTMFISTTLYLWVGNHSAYAFAHLYPELLPLSMEKSYIVYAAIPVGIWLATTLVIFRNGSKGYFFLSYLTASIFVMDLLPATSHDYKLVILAVPVVLSVVITSVLLLSSKKSGFMDALSILLLSITILIFGFINISCETSFEIFKNKYPLVLLLQMTTSAILLLGSFKAKTIGWEPT